MLYPDHILKSMDPKDRNALGKKGLTQSEIMSQAIAKDERDLQVNLVNLLRLRDIQVLWPRSDKRSRITLGWPDITFCYEGVPVCWEVKFAKGKLSKEQEELHPKLIRDGWRVFIIRSIQDGKACLDAIYYQQHPL